MDSDNSQPPPPYYSLYPTQHNGRGSSQDVDDVLAGFGTQVPTISERPDTSANAISFDQDEILISKDSTGRQHYNSVERIAPPSPYTYLEFHKGDHGSTDSDQLAERFDRLCLGDRSVYTSSSLNDNDWYEYCSYTMRPYGQDNLPDVTEPSSQYGARMPTVSKRIDFGASRKDAYMPITHDRRNTGSRRYKSDSEHVPPGRQTDKQDRKGQQCSADEDQSAESMSRVGLKHHSASKSNSPESDDQRAYCRHPSCLDANGNPTKSFSRKADVARHTRSAHERRYIDCLRRNYVRKGDQRFTRSDHLQEHLRQFRIEKIPKSRKDVERVL